MKHCSQWAVLAQSFSRKQWGSVHHQAFTLPFWFGGITKRMLPCYTKLSFSCIDSFVLTLKKASVQLHSRTHQGSVKIWACSGLSAAMRMEKGVTPLGNCAARPRVTAEVLLWKVDSQPTMIHSNSMQNMQKATVGTSVPQVLPLLTMKLCAGNKPSCLCVLSVWTCTNVYICLRMCVWDSVQYHSWLTTCELCLCSLALYKQYKKILKSESMNVEPNNIIMKSPLISTLNISVQVMFNLDSYSTCSIRARSICIMLKLASKWQAYAHGKLGPDVFTTVSLWNGPQDTPEIG